MPVLFMFINQNVKRASFHALLERDINALTLALSVMVTMIVTTISMKKIVKVCIKSQIISI